MHILIYPNIKTPTKRYKSKILIRYLRVVFLLFGDYYDVHMTMYPYFRMAKPPLMENDTYAVCWAEQIFFGTYRQVTVTACHLRSFAVVSLRIDAHELAMKPR